MHLGRGRSHTQPAATSLRFRGLGFSVLPFRVLRVRFLGVRVLGVWILGFGALGFGVLGFRSTKRVRFRAWSSRLRVRSEGDMLGVQGHIRMMHIFWLRV